MGEEIYELNEPGTFLISSDARAKIDYNAIGKDIRHVEPLAVFVKGPVWWEPYTGEARNSSGYVGNQNVGVYKLSERKDPRTGLPISWMNDSVSLKPESIHGTLGFSYVRPKNMNPQDRDVGRMIPIFANRPEESIHRHPCVSRYRSDSNIQGLAEFYLVLSGKIGIGTFNTNEDVLNYHLLGKGQVLGIEPEEIHGVLATSVDFQYVCVQVPSCYHYPFDYNKHHFAYVAEMETRLGFDVVSTLLGAEEPGDYMTKESITAVCL
jgi:hypothetical protein